MPARQLNPQHPAPQQQFNSHIKNTSRMRKSMEHLIPDRMKKDMENSIPEWRVEQSIQKSSVFQHTASNTRVEGSSYSSVTGLFSYKSNSNNKFQVFVKPATA